MNTVPSNPFFQWQTSMVNESIAALGRFSNLPSVWQWQQAERVKKGVTESKIIYEEESVTVLHYVGSKAPKYKTPLIFIYALVNRPYILDLKKGRSVVAHFVDRGFDTYLVDWGIPTYADRHHSLDDYINGYMINVADYICERTGTKQASVLGYCMGGTMSTMFTALYQERVKNLILLAAPVDFSARDNLLSIWSQPENFDVDNFIAAFGNCPAEFLQGLFLQLRPVGNLIEKPIRFAENMQEDKFLADFFTTETWLNDNIPIPGEIYREFVKYLYQQNLLAKNRLRVGQKIVNLRDITCPVLNIMADHDDLVSCSQGLPFTDLVGSEDRKTLLLKGGGHIGLAIGSKAQHEIWPQACEWLAKRD
ncbi:MAG: alpha/beta fold hydrolase [Limisphaerales bacterium]